MRRSSSFLISVSFALSMPVAAADLAGAVSGQAARDAHGQRPSTTYGSVTVADPYRWLEDQNAPETRAWIDAQNQYSDGVPARASRAATRSASGSASC